jgi:uncharacterized GH25 family protein
VVVIRSLRNEVKGAALAALFFLSAAPAIAHDLWLEPSGFVVPTGERVEVSLRLGHADAPETQRRDERRIVRFVAAGPLGGDSAEETPVLGFDGADPAGVLKPTGPGRYVLGYRTADALSELPAERFESYLEEEGLEAVSAARARRGESDAAGTERFSRAAKALVTVGSSGETADPADRRLGFRLELVAETDPLRWKSGDELPVRLWFEDEPAAGVLVDAFSLDRPGETLRARTDAEGRVRLELPGPGRWVVAAVHMVEAPADTDQDWQSVWASLSFAAGPPPRNPS